MPLYEQNLTLAMGADYSLRFRGSTTNTVSGYSLSFDIRPTPDADAIVTKTTSDGIAVTGSSGAWVITVTIADTDIDDDAVDTDSDYLWSLWRTGAGVTYPLAQGKVRFADSAYVG
jgi:hypothetical protein